MKKRILFVCLILLIVSLNFIGAETLFNDSSEINSNLNTVFSETIVIPNGLDILARIFLGVNKEVELSLLIVAICFCIGVFVIILDVVKLLPFVNREPITYIASLCFVALAGISGGILDAAKFFLEFGKIFKVFQEISSVSFIFSIVALIIVFLILYFIFKIVGNLSQKTKMDEVAEEASEGIKIHRTTARVWKKVLGKKD